jgi:hypothetical protein
MVPHVMRRGCGDASRAIPGPRGYHAQHRGLSPWLGTSVMPHLLSAVVLQKFGTVQRAGGEQWFGVWRGPALNWGGRWAGGMPAAGVLAVW